MVSSDLVTEVKNLRIAVFELHLKHKSLAGELQRHRDTDATNKANLIHLKGILFVSLKSYYSKVLSSINVLYYVGVDRIMMLFNVYDFLV